MKLWTKKENTASAIDLSRKEVRKGNYVVATQSSVFVPNIAQPDTEVKEGGAVLDFKCRVSQHSAGRLPRACALAMTVVVEGCVRRFTLGGGRYPVGGGSAPALQGNIPVRDLVTNNLLT